MTSHFNEQTKKAMHGKIMKVWGLAKKWMDNPPQDDEQAEAMTSEFHQLCLAYESDAFMVAIASDTCTELIRLIN